MKKIFAVFAFVFLAFPTVIFASSKQDYQDIVTVQPDEVIDGDFFAAGERVDVYGTVMGDVYAAGGIINIDGTVTGDVIVAGGDVTIAGNVGQDLRAAGGNIVISGQVEKNITVAGGNVEISRTAQANRNVYIGAGSFYLAGEINGDLTYATDPEEENILETASVSGSITSHTPDLEKARMERMEMEKAARGFNLGTKLISFLSTLILGYLVVRFLPKYADRASELILTSFWKSFFIGLASFIVFPLAIVFSFVTIVGIPIAIILAAIFVAYGFIARVYVMIAVGKKVSDWSGSKIKGAMLTFSLGLVAYYLLSLIPIVGGLVKFFVIIAGFGAAVRNIRNTYYLGRGKKIF